MLRLDIISCVPALLEGPLSHSLIKRAQDKGHLKVCIHSLRDYASAPHHQVDDYSYGGGGGMVLQIEPIARCIESLRRQRSYDAVILMSPTGRRMDHQAVCELSLKSNMIVLCGHYKGVDERVRALFVTHEMSIGDYVLTGGELPALVLCDALARLQPGVLNRIETALSDSFVDGLLAPPVYTRPANYKGHRVPDILCSGDAKAIAEWRHQQALARTKKHRPDLLMQMMKKKKKGKQGNK